MTRGPGPHLARSLEIDRALGRRRRCIRGQLTLGRWDVTAAGVYFLDMTRPDREATPLRFFDLATGRTSTVVDMPPNPSSNGGRLAAGPDGAYVIADFIDREGVDLLMIEPFR